MSLPPGYRKFRDALIEANRHDFYPPHWLDQQVAIGMAHPVIGESSAMVVGIRTYPGGARVGHIKAAAGDMDELIHVLGPQAEEWGRAHGCQLAMIDGRTGWSRALKDHGWRDYQISLLKDL